MFRPVLAYPRTQEDLDALLASEQSCRAHLAQVRWPEGFRCPACGGSSAWVLPGDVWACRGCRRKTSLTAGTLFHDSRLPLRRWFAAIWYVVGQKNGASALGVQRLLGMGSYHTAWAWLHRLRRAMVRPGRDRLSGTVQVDEIYLGGRRPGTGGRGAAGKHLIFVAVAHEGKRVQRVRMQLIPDASGPALLAAVTECIEPGSIVETDGWMGYAPIVSAGYTRCRIRAADWLDADPLPLVHTLASLLKRWLLGTHQGAVRATHLAYYLDEFTFRFNRRHSRSRGLLFHRVLEHAVQHGPLREADLRAAATQRDPHI